MNESLNDWDSFADGVARRHYGSLNDMATAAKAGVAKGRKNIKNGGNHVFNGLATARMDSDFCPTSYAESQAMASGKGWGEALSMIESERLRLPESGAPDLGILWDVTGAEVDVSTWLEGEPECMIDFDMNEPAASVVTVAVDLATPWNVSASTLLQRAATIASVVEWSRSTGITVNVVGVCKLDTDYGRDDLAATVYSVFLGDSRGAFNPAMIAYGCGHPAVLRRQVFGLMDGEDESVRKAWGGSRGGPMFITVKDLPLQYREGAVVVLDAARAGHPPLQVGDVLATIRKAAEDHAA
jgi:hypothetical protein